MTITTIYRIFFPQNEYTERHKFEQESPQYRKISEDTLGATYEYSTEYIVNFTEENKNSKR